MKAVFAGGSSSSFKRAFWACRFIMPASARMKTFLRPSLGMTCASETRPRTWSTVISRRLRPCESSPAETRTMSGWFPASDLRQARQRPQGRSTPSASQSMAAASVRARPSRASSFMEAAIYAWASSVPPGILNASISFILPFRGGGVNSICAGICFLGRLYKAWEAKAARPGREKCGARALCGN